MVKEAFGHCPAISHHMDCLIGTKNAPLEFLNFMFEPSYKILKSQFRRLFNGKAWGQLAVLVTLAMERPLDAAGPTPTPVIPTSISTQPSGASLLSGGTMELKLTPKGSGTLTYQWYKSSTVATLAGSPGMTGNADGITGASLMGGPVGMAFYNKALYVADCGNNTIRKIDFQPAGTDTRVIMSTFAGIPGLEGAQNGSHETATFSKPFGVAVDTAGNVYVSDSGNHLIRKIRTDGTVSTVAGKAGLPGDRDGRGSDAQFNYPTGLAVDGSGNLFVADAGNHQIRKGVLSSGSVTSVAGKAGFPQI